MGDGIAPLDDDGHEPDDDGWDCDCPVHNPSLYTAEGDVRPELGFLVKRSAAELMKEADDA